MKVGFVLLILGVIALYESPMARQGTHVQIAIEIGIVTLISFIVGALVQFTFRGRKKDSKQQSGGFGYAARNRTGRS